MSEANGRAGCEPLGDEALMSEVANGKSEALDALYARYAALVFQIAARTLDRSSAEDIVQDVFLAVWHKAATFDPSRGTFRVWVLRIAHLRVLNELRRRGRRPRVDHSPDGVMPLDPGPGPIEELGRAQRRAAVRRALETLPAPQRQALRLSFLEELTHEQVAASLNLPLGTAKSRIRAGLQAMRTRLAPLVAAGLVAAGLLMLWGLRESAYDRSRRALDMVTHSDVAPIRLSAGPGIPPATHGNYRARPGTPLAVLTVSNLAPAPTGSVYRAWARQRGRWIMLGIVRPDSQGRDLLIAEGGGLAERPEALQVTIEPRGPSEAPTGRVVMSWAGR